MNKDVRNKIKDFKGLISWQTAHKLVLFVYTATKEFPNEELYGRTSQMRRAAVSITSNIAEGFGRQGYKEKIQFYYFAQGSLIELKNQIEIAHDVNYLSGADYSKIKELSDQSHRLLQGLIKKSKDIFNS